ncbi:MAG TPA: hypothetical protein VFT46_09355 [Holophagaceae bacterium]|nr:hypothetical protein [Holophagaceae bacterium]
MSASFRTRQAGEGKVGCFLTLAIVVVAVAAGIKAIPIYYSNNELVTACENDIAPMASRATDEEVMAQVRAKAKELEIQEALAPGAITVKVIPSGNDNTPGNVHIGLNYSRDVDFYGITTYKFETKQSIDRTVYTNIK